MIPLYFLRLWYSNTLHLSTLQISHCPSRIPIFRRFLNSDPGILTLDFATSDQPWHNNKVSPSSLAQPYMSVTLRPATDTDSTLPNQPKVSGSHDCTWLTNWNLTKIHDIYGRSTCQSQKALLQDRKSTTVQCCNTLTDKPQLQPSPIAILWMDGTHGVIYTKQ